MKTSKTLSIVMAVAVLSCAGGMAQAVGLQWDFWHDGAGDANGWTTLMGYPAGFRSGDGGGVGPDGPTQREPGYAWDNQHPNFLFESPAFNFDGTTIDGTNALRIVSAGGQGQQSGSIAPYANPGAIPAANTTTNGLKGWAFLNTTTGQYDAAVFKPNNGGHTMNMTAAQLTSAGVDLGQEYRLHFYETDHGGWGWTQLNEVLIAGNTGPTIHEIGGDGVIGIDTLTGTQGNETYGAGPTGAKYVRVVQNVNDTFQVAELQVFQTGTGTNVALGGTASAKDNYQNNASLPARAKDGNTELMIYFSGGVTSWEALGPDSEYYKVKLVYDPVAASADFYINDSSVAIQNDLMPGATGATVQRVWWGQQDNGDQSRGNVYWNSVILNILTDPVCGDLGHPQPIGDLDGNCVVDIIDVTLMAAHWLERTFP